MSARAWLAVIVALAACGAEPETPLEPSTASTGLRPSAAAANKGLRICAWGLGDFASNTSFLNSRMSQDGTFEISQYLNDPSATEPPGPGQPFIIDSDPVAGLTTVYGDSLVVIQGNLAARSYSSDPLGEPPPADTTAVTLALDLRLVVTPTRGTGAHPEGEGGSSFTRFMRLSGTISGLSVGSGSDLTKAPFRGRFGDGGAATPFHWFGSNGEVQFCTSKPTGA
jgi:hypothetical protein